MESSSKERNKNLFRQMANDPAYVHRMVTYPGCDGGKRNADNRSRQLIYLCVNGASYNMRIAHAIAVVYRYFRMREHKFNQILEATVQV